MGIKVLRDTLEGVVYSRHTVYYLFVEESSFLLLLAISHLTQHSNSLLCLMIQRNVVKGTEWSSTFRSMEELSSVLVEGGCPARSFSLHHCPSWVSQRGAVWSSCPLSDGVHIPCRTICKPGPRLLGQLIIWAQAPPVTQKPLWQDWKPVALEPREGDGTPLQYSCLEKPMDWGAW